MDKSSQKALIEGHGQKYRKWECLDWWNARTTRNITTLTGFSLSIFLQVQHQTLTHLAKGGRSEITDPEMSASLVGSFGWVALVMFAVIRRLFE